MSSLPGRSSALIALVSFGAAGGFCQQVSVASSATAGVSYIVPRLLSATARPFVGALGNRVQHPGYERSTLTGTFTDQSGSETARLVWEAPGKFRFDRNGSGRTLIYQPGKGLVGNVSAADANIMESLLDDTAESFLYGFGNGYSYRLLGVHYRSDNGKTPNFTGPWYDVYQVVGSPKAQAAAPQRWKAYFYDSAAKLLAMTQYTASGVQVSTQFHNWFTSGTERYPGQIVRKENGTVVFTFTVTQAAAGPAAADGLFQ